MYQEKEKREVERIRSQYLDKEETNLTKLQKLDNKVHVPAEIFAYAYGLVGALILGVGMCLSMNVIGASFHIALGIVIGLLGIAIVCSNYPIYSLLLKSRKKKYSQEIMQLSDSILNVQ